MQSVKLSGNVSVSYSILIDNEGTIIMAIIAYRGGFFMGTTAVTVSDEDTVMGCVRVGLREIFRGLDPQKEKPVRVNSCYNIYGRKIKRTRR